MDTEISEYPPITELSRLQRRIIGVLLEKAFTTPDSYPLTLKSLATGCNQKSNRDPVSNYSEDAVLDGLDELRKMGAVAVVHTETGRSERYRHYMRKRFKFSERQLAILAELLLRGRQTLGELRARAGRMVPIDSLDILRDDLQVLLNDGFVQASGSLERRGIEVDHTFYQESEQKKNFAPMVRTDPVEDETESSQSDKESPEPVPASVPYETLVKLEQLKVEHDELKEEFQELKAQFEQMKNDLGEFKKELGG